jgi:hypothetical protein
MIVVTFAAEAELARGLHRARSAAIGPIETYTPAPPSHAPVTSPVPLIILAAGLIGGTASFLLQTYSSTVAYRFDIGGRPSLSWPSFIPTAFENAALIAIAAGLFAFMAVNRMPRLYEPVDEAAGIRRASQDRWVLCVRSDDPTVFERVRTMMRDLDPLLVEEIAE